MHVPYRPGGLKDISASLDSGLLRLQTELELDDSQWREVLGLSALDFRMYSERRLELPFSALHRVSENYNLSVEAIVQNEIDYPTLIAQVNGNLWAVPSEFLCMARSRRRTLQHLLDCAEKTLGWQYRRFIMRRFQLNEACLSDPEAPINVLLMIKVVDLMRSAGLKPPQFHELGSECVVRYSNSHLARHLQPMKSANDVYVKLIEEIVPFLSGNCEYQITRSQGQSLTLEIRDSPEVLEAFKLRHFGRPEFCAFKLGLFRVAPSFAGFPYSEVKETKCTNHGYAACEIEVNFRPAIALTPEER